MYSHSSNDDSNIIIPCLLSGYWDIGKLSKACCDPVNHCIHKMCFVHAKRFIWSGCV